MHAFALRPNVPAEGPTERRSKSCQTIFVSYQDGVTFPDDASDLHGWLYVSECRLPSSWMESAVADIVAVSRARNAPLKVTGALLFTGEWFAQFIEGPECAVAALRLSIVRDARHAGVQTILDGSRSHRLFEEWSLAYSGPSLFVSGQVKAALQDADSTCGLLRVLQEFAARS